jgi:hypothetical protein
MEKLLSLKAIQIKMYSPDTRLLNSNEIDRTTETAKGDTSNIAEKARINN